jgi:hypothetical protein
LAPAAEPAATPAAFLFQRALPLGQLVLCAILLWPARPMIAYRLGLPALAGPSFFFRIGVPILQKFARWSVQNGMQTVSAINLPAGLLQLPSIIFTADHREWMPPGMDFQVWRAITWPILGMPFWWIAGRGADALVAARRHTLAPRIVWVETVIGFLFMAAGATAVIGVEFFSGSDRNDLQSLAAVSGLWAVLGGFSVAAKIVQWRLRKTLAGQRG